LKYPTFKDTKDLDSLLSSLTYNDDKTEAHYLSHGKAAWLSGLKTIAGIVDPLHVQVASDDEDGDDRERRDGSREKKGESQEKREESKEKGQISASNGGEVISAQQQSGNSAITPRSPPNLRCKVDESRLADVSVAQVKIS